jgi:arylsulfate sulfotransferase
MQSRVSLLCAISLLTVLTGCGGGSSNSNSGTAGSSGSTTGPADFTLAIAPASVTITPGGAAQTVTVTASPVNGFTGNVSIAVGSLPSGVAATPMTLSMAPGGLQQISLTATSAAAAGNATISLQATSGSLSHSITTALTVSPAVPPASTNAALSGSSYSFGNNLVNNTVTQSVVTVTNTGTTALTMNPALSGDPSYALVSTGSCGAQLAAAATCAVMVSYTPATASTPGTQTASLNLGFVGVPDGTPQTVALSGTSAALPTGQVSATDNPQVALYTMTLPFPGSMTVSFGKDTTYGTNTWTQSTAESGGVVSIFVAGMQGSTAYHMQASVQFTNGISAKDSDHPFTTQAVPANMQPKLTAATTPGMTPQPGVELLNMLNGKPNGLAVTDLAGNVLWTYAAPGPATNYVQGAKLLPNGDFLMAIGPNSVAGLSTIPPGTISEIREINLAGDTVREIEINDLNALLSVATCAECNVTLQSLHHDVEPLPNGHWLVLGNTTMQLSPTTTPPLTNLPPATVLGDVIIDLDQNLKPVWAWNAFNHLDPNRHPYMWPDWTHANAVLYSKDDGNILISMRHQNTVYKVDYEDGKGSGAIIWRLGEGGNFTLKNGTDPNDWQYAQHYPSFFSSNTTGVFSLGVMDNGDDRIFASGSSCISPNNPSCLYSTIPVFQIDENAMTATLTTHYILPANLYNSFGGSVNLLPNANIEYDLCALPIGISSEIFEVTPQSTPQTVWTMQITGTNAYRGFRIPSLYPGVQW